MARTLPFNTRTLGIVVYNANNEPVREFDTTPEAWKYFCISESTLRTHCERNMPTTDGPYSPMKMLGDVYIRYRDEDTWRKHADEKAANRAREDAKWVVQHTVCENLKLVAILSMERRAAVAQVNEELQNVLEHLPERGITIFINEKADAARQRVQDIFRQQYEEDIKGIAAELDVLAVEEGFPIYPECKTRISDLKAMCGTALYEKRVGSETEPGALCINAHRNWNHIKSAFDELKLCREIYLLMSYNPQTWAILPFLRSLRDLRANSMTWVDFDLPGEYRTTCISAIGPRTPRARKSARYDNTMLMTLARQWYDGIIAHLAIGLGYYIDKMPLRPLVKDSAKEPAEANHEFFPEDETAERKARQVAEGEARLQELHEILETVKHPDTGTDVDEDDAEDEGITFDEADIARMEKFNRLRKRKRKPRTKK